MREDSWRKGEEDHEGWNEMKMKGKERAKGERSGIGGRMENSLIVVVVERGREV